RRFRSVKAVATGARAGGVGIVDREALLLDRVDEVNGRAHQVWPAQPVGDDVHSAKDVDDVAVEAALVEEQLVAQSRAATWLHGDAQRKILTPLTFQEGLDLGCRLVGQDNAVCRCGGAVEGLFGCRHGCHSRGARWPRKAGKKCAPSPNPGAGPPASPRSEAP